MLRCFVSVIAPRQERRTTTAQRTRRNATGFACGALFVPFVFFVVRSFLPCYSRQMNSTDRMQNGRGPSGSGKREQGRRQGRAERVAPLVQRGFERYHSPDWIGEDPLRWPRKFAARDDREVAAFLASILAYGNVKQINRSLGDLFARMDLSPAEFVRNFEPGRSDRALAGFKHRFNDAIDLAATCHLLGQMLRGWGSIEAFWADAQDESCGGAPPGATPGGTLALANPPAPPADIADRAGRFIDAALALDLEPYAERVGTPVRLPFLYLWPRAAGSSAAKRMNLFLRWVVRPDDGIDLGLWTIEHPRDLQFPVDTHIGRLARYLGATRRRSADARTRREITAFFKRIDPDDPVRFDFSLCRLGILKRCPSRARLELCELCELKPACLRHRELSRRVGARPVVR